MSNNKVEEHENVLVGWMVSVAELLDANGIPNVLWDEFVSLVSGYFFPLQSIQFIVPDELIDKAREVLLAANFPPCKEGKDCCFFNPINHFQAPYTHFVLVDGNERGRKHHVTLALHKKSQQLWKTADIPLGAPAPNDPDYMLVTDERLPESTPNNPAGRITHTRHPVKMPTMERFAEALALLCIRDNPPNLKFEVHPIFTRIGISGRKWYNDVLDLAEYNLLKWEGVVDPRARRFLELYVDRKTPQEAYKYCHEMHLEMHKDNSFPPFCPLLEPEQY